MSFLTKRIDLGAEAGYADFREQSHLLIGQQIRRMSKLTGRLMQSINYQRIAEQRRRNFRLLHDSLKDTNLYNIHLDEESVPMVYPYLTAREGLRELLIQNKIFIATYWPSVLKFNQINTSEQQLVNQLLPLPIDQRYLDEDMNTIIQHIVNG